MSIQSSSGPESKWAPLHSALRKWSPLVWDFVVKYGPGIAVIIFGFWTAITWAYQRSDQYALEKVRKDETARSCAARIPKTISREAVGIIFRSCQGNRRALYDEPRLRNLGPPHDTDFGSSIGANLVW